MSVPVSCMHTDAVHVMDVFRVVTEMSGMATNILTVIFICYRIHHRCIYGSCESKGCQCSKRDQANHQIFFLVKRMKKNAKFMATLHSFALYFLQNLIFSENYHQGGHIEWNSFL